MGRKEGRKTDPVNIDRVLEDLEIRAILDDAEQERAKSPRTRRLDSWIHPDGDAALD